VTYISRFVIIWSFAYPPPQFCALPVVVTFSEIWKCSFPKIRYISIWTSLHQISSWYRFIKV